jgi:hypothetical protein
MLECKIANNVFKICMWLSPNTEIPCRIIRRHTDKYINKT